MAQTEEEKLQADLFAEFQTTEVTVASDKAAEMKENILNDKGSSTYLGIGTHDVFIKSVELTKAKTGTFGIRVNVENPDGKSDVTFWVSEAALPYSIENISRLVVHNTAEDKKNEARTYMANVTSAKELFTVAQQKLVDGVGFLRIRASKTQTYVNKDGETVPSLERDLLSYRPKDEVEQTATAIVGGGKPANKAEIPF